MALVYLLPCEDLRVFYDVLQKIYKVVLIYFVIFRISLEKKIHDQPL